MLLNCVLLLSSAALLCLGESVLGNGNRSSSNNTFELEQNRTALNSTGTINRTNTNASFSDFYKVIEDANLNTKFPIGKLFFDAPSKNKYFMDESLPIVLVNATGDSQLAPKGYIHPKYGNIQVCLQIIGTTMQWTSSSLIGIFDLDHVINQKESLSRFNARVIRWSPPSQWTTLTPDSYFYIQADLSYKKFGSACSKKNPKIISNFFNLQFREWEDEGFDWSPKL